METNFQPGCLNGGVCTYKSARPFAICLSDQSPGEWVKAYGNYSVDSARVVGRWLFAWFRLN